jgi:hypothetical protein
MQLKHLNILDTVRRVQGFIVRQAAALGALVTAALSAQLDDAGTQLASFQQEQGAAASAAKGETANQAAYRKNFYAKFMRPIARIAKARLKLAPDYSALRVPTRGLRNGDFAGTAQTLVDTAAKYEKDFLAGGMAADFLAQMRAAIAQLTASKAAGDQAVSRRQAATKGIAQASLAARDAFVVLDSAIAPAVKHNASLLADWRASKKIVTATTLPPQPTGLAPATPTTPAAGPTPVVAPVAPSAPATPTAPTPAPASQPATPAA